MSHISLVVRDVTQATAHLGSVGPPLFVAEIHRDDRHVISSSAFHKPQEAMDAMLSTFTKVIDGAIAPVTSSVVMPATDELA